MTYVQSQQWRHLWLSPQRPSPELENTHFRAWDYPESQKWEPFRSTPKLPHLYKKWPRIQKLTPQALKINSRALTEPKTRAIQIKLKFGTLIQNGHDVSTLPPRNTLTCIYRCPARAYNERFNLYYLVLKWPCAINKSRHSVRQI